MRGIILNTRPKKSAAAYAKVWTDEGSPLIVFSERVKSKLEVRLDGIPVALGMRYGEPSIERGLNELAALGVDDVLVVPLYPSTLCQQRRLWLKKCEVIAQKHEGIRVQGVAPFYKDESYINCHGCICSEGCNPRVYDRILFSYHGVPERHIRKSDLTGSHCKIDGTCCHTPSKAHEECYRHQCFPKRPSLWRRR